ncbi:sigma intracellular receptor 2, partial [Tremellales sp. Uapishka_1]
MVFPGFGHYHLVIPGRMEPCKFLLPGDASLRNLYPEPSPAGQAERGPSAMQSSTPSRFEGRPLDQIWFAFFIMHIPTTLLLDVQCLYPPGLLKNTPFPAFLDWYLSFSRDPILLGAGSGLREWDWLRKFIWMEACVQLPCFIIGAIGLWRNDKRVYPVLLAYGASTATTLVPTLSALLADYVSPPLTPSELGLLLSSYLPFLFIPLGIALDMGIRLAKMAGANQKSKTA